MALLNLDLACYKADNMLEIPEIKPCQQFNISEWIGFNYARTESNCTDKTGCHFFLDDYQFESVWKYPNRYLDNMRKCGVVLSPDFSMFVNMPYAVQIFNHYRKHWIAKYWQDYGVNIIPTISWSDEDSYVWCFDGEPKNSVVAVSSIGCLDDKESQDLFSKGFDAMLCNLNPSKILFFTSTKNCRLLDRYKLCNVEFIDSCVFDK